MPYIEGRVVHDADAHIMEEPTWLLDHADPAVREQLQPQRRARARRRARPRPSPRCGPSTPTRSSGRDEADEIMARKNFKATGSSIAEDRPLALDLLGFASQLVFNTFNNGHLAAPRAQRRPRPRLRRRPGPQPRHGRVLLGRPAAAAHLLRAARRLRPGAAMAGEAIAMGAAALLVPSAAARTTTPPATSASTPCGRQAEEAGIPIVLHVGGGGQLLAPEVLRERRRLRRPTSTAATRTSGRSTTWPSPGRPTQTLATMIFDGVLERFPRLKIGVIEQGAIWVPSWMRQMESAFDAFAAPRGAPPGPVAAARASSCSARSGPRRTPPRTSAGSSSRPAPRCRLFSTDYPHVEGGRRPIERFEASLGDASEAVRQAFYCDNFVDLMGTSAGADRRPDAPPEAAWGSPIGSAVCPPSTSPAACRLKRRSDRTRGWSTRCTSSTWPTRRR